MADEKKPEGMNPVEEKLIEENPDQTIAPPELKLQEKPIPNPNLDVDNK